MIATTRTARPFPHGLVPELGHAPGRSREVACLTHVRRKFFDVHADQGSVIAAEALKRIAALYAIQKEAHGQLPERRAGIRRAIGIATDRMPRRANLGYAGGYACPSGSKEFTGLRLGSLGGNQPDDLGDHA